MPVNFEFKARCNDLQRAEECLLPLQPLFIGTDRQVDTYFNVSHGRLKLREGSIENALIHYSRSDTAGAKQSDVILYQHSPEPNLKEALTRALGIRTIVDKERKIYFVGNVKFHFDMVRELGTFVEVEAIDKDGSIGLEQLKEQCLGYTQLLEIKEEAFVA